MPVPFAIAASAAAASLAYLHAKSGFSHDRLLFRAVFLALARVSSRKRSGRLNLFFELEDRVKNPKTASKPFIWFEGKTITYAQAYDRSLRYGNWLRTKFGIKPKDMVAINFENSETFILIWLAIWSIGAIPVFLNYNLRGNSLAHCIKSSSAKICVIDPAVSSAFDDFVKGELSHVNLIFFTPDIDAEASSFAATKSPDSDIAESELAETAVLIFTSGTTGLPKPAIISWTKVWFGSCHPEVFLNRGARDDIMYTSMPLYHASAAVMCACSTLIAGSTLALGRKFSTKSFWQDVRASKATSIQYVGETLRYLLAAPPQVDPVTGEDLDKKHNVRVAFGNGLRIDVWNKFKERFNIDSILEFYGATDGPASTWILSKNDFTAGSIGHIGWLYSSLVRWKLVEVDHETEAPKRNPKTGFCIQVPPGQPGEMIYRLPPQNIKERFQGYFGNPKANQAKILRDVFLKGDAYFRSGDILRFDSDGRLYFSDRIGDSFRWKAENVSTAEVSEAIGSHPNVREANVYGVEVPNHDGRAGCVAICFNQETKVPSSETLRSLAEHVRATLPRYARPLFLRLVHEVAAPGQTTGTNKQQKHGLRVAGVKPTPEVELYWLQDDTYVPFGEKEWRLLERGRVKL